MIAFHQRMATPEAQKQYRRRGPVIESCHAWIKSKLGLRQFHLRGLAKVQMEVLGACLTYDLQPVDPTAPNCKAQPLTPQRPESQRETF